MDADIELFAKFLKSVDIKYIVGIVGGGRSIRLVNELCKITEENHSTLILATHDNKIANNMNLVFELKNNKLQNIKYE